ncbi:hypothetical protein Hypma_003370 [Hypsizygus marmoreus]|uniref:Uncharacterized protein n=1 Tax=Hypsizygus marmoreus TaxID=39966 RepID=A0A369J8Q2_HYPMA|nr:hypothetical protein Hypma_003370 [Hypsizygus marmoreus]
MIHYLQACKYFLGLHVLFPAGQTVDAAYGAPLPIASVALSLDEVQYRCAGYIQAEIERYGDILDDRTDEADAEAKDSNEYSSNEEREDDASTEKRRKVPNLLLISTSVGTVTYSYYGFQCPRTLGQVFLRVCFLTGLCAGNIFPFMDWFNKHEYRDRTVFGTVSSYSLLACTSRLSHR